MREQKPPLATFHYPTNLLLFTLVLVLVTFGLNILLASSSFMAREQFNDPYFFLKKQVVAAGIGFLALLALTQTPPRHYRSWAWPLYFLTLILLLLVFVPGIGRRAGGASRWLAIAGISLQPSDFAKVAVVLVLARIYAQAERVDLRLIGITLAVIALPVFLIAIEEDLGTAVHLLFVAGALLFFTRYPLSLQFLSLTVALAIFVYAIIKTPFRMTRIKAFLDPWESRFDAGFQLVASMKAFLAGGLTGKGFGAELIRHHLQERHTDFILAIVAEDFGAIGVIALLLIYFTIAIYGLVLAARLRDDFSRLIATGFLLSIILQVIINSGVTMGLLPTKGINLPLVSGGGTSLVVHLVMFGMVLSALRTER